MFRVLVSALVLAVSTGGGPSMGSAASRADRSASAPPLAIAAGAGGVVPDAPVVLVELFTSEGCSSCPPADALLGRLAREPVGAARVVALSEHVDYWDDLGWRDRFSSPVFTRRQEAYVRRLGLAGPYTPELVVAGRTDVLGGDARRARSAIAAAAAAPSGRITARVLGDAQAGLAVEVDAAWRAGIPADVLLAVVQDHAATRVERGENAGRTLEHVAVVRSMGVLGSGVGAFSGAAAVPRRDAPGAGHLVLFVQEREGGPVDAVTSVALP